MHLPGSGIPARAVAELDPAVPVVTHCWGPGRSGATRAALSLARLGFRCGRCSAASSRAREGLPVATADGVAARPADPLTTPLACGC